MEYRDVGKKIFYSLEQHLTCSRSMSRSLPGIVSSRFSMFRAMSGAEMDYRHRKHRFKVTVPEDLTTAEHFKSTVGVYPTEERKLWFHSGCMPSSDRP